jgi:SAM-dependent methyltransferase
MPSYIKDVRKIKEQKGEDNAFPFGKSSPILGERFSQAGAMSNDYFFQDLYVAQKIFERNPARHVDIGSRIDGFIAHLAVFRSVEVVDIRPLNLKVKNICFRQADLMKLPDDMIDYTDSVSSLHSIEHFGLGRYGDPVDYFGHRKALTNICRILRTGGVFYFSTPIGKQRIEFNAQRVFDIKYLLDLFAEDYMLSCFSYIDDEGKFYENVKMTEADIQSNFGCNTGCGIFELIKK